MNLFSERLQATRRGKKRTQKELALHIGIAERNYRKYESGEIEPNLISLLQIADFLEVSVDYLMGRTDNPNVNH